MPKKTQSRGTCTYCGEITAKGSMSKHLKSCAKRQEAIAAANPKNGAAENLIHLRIQSEDTPDMWLNLEMRSSATLKKLDDYLRAIWLECCGHLSQFTVGGAWSGTKVGMTRKAGDVLHDGVKLTHIYDFGTSSETSIKVVDQRVGIPTTKHPIALMARNLMPEAKCIECDKPAKWLCMECMVEDEVVGFLCDEHAETHPHEDYGEPLLVVNSPRVGMCGDVSPAEPPY